MWFKNLRLFEFTEPFKKSQDELIAALSESEFQPCGSHVAASMGWISPMEQEGAPLVHSANGYLLFCLKVQEKIIPATVVRELAEEQAKDIEKKEDRKVYKKERQRIRDDIYHDLLSRALCKSSRLYGYIDLKQQVLVVNTGSATKAELFNTFLRKSLGGLKTALPEVQTPSVIMTNWLQQSDQMEDFSIDDFCVLQDADQSGGSVRCSHQDLTTEAIQGLIEEGKSVTQLGLNWCDQATFVLHDDFSVSKLKFLDAVQAQADDIFTESEADRFDANFTIMTETCHLLIQSLNQQFAAQAEVKTESEALEVA